MKRVYLLLFLYLFIPAAGFAAELAQFKGKVLDAANQAPLAGATIYITDLKAITTTNAQGEFVLKNIPAKGRFLLEARFVGYKTYAAVIDLGSQKELTISLSPSIIESAEVVITGSPFSSNNKTNSLSVVSVGKNKLAQSGGTNLVDAIARIPGVSQVSTGGAISKPVIRGLGYNRVLTMFLYCDFLFLKEYVLLYGCLQ